MTDAVRPVLRPVIGPDGTLLSLHNIPSADKTRWVIRRKAEVVAAVHGGLLSIEAACARYALTVEEYLAWELAIENHGFAGLRTTRLQQYRR